MERTLIDIAGLCAERREADRRFLFSVESFCLAPGDRVAIVGPSGCGKSTFLETVACGRAPASADRFRVRFGPSGEAVDVASAWANGRENALTRLRASTFGYVHQTGGLLGFLSVRDNIAMTQRLSGRNDPALIARLGGALDIADLYASWPAKLSGGQRQRVAIARALAHRPLVVVADEPTASLDPQNARIVMRLLAEAAAESGSALLIATHDLALASRFGFALLAIDNPTESGGERHGESGEAARATNPARHLAVLPRYPEGGLS